MKLSLVKTPVSGITGLREPLLAALLVVAVSALAYLPLIHTLGYYHDDWFTTVSNISGTNLEHMHSIDRPLMGRLYDKTYALLGDVPLAWHLAAFTMRTSASLFFLWLMRMLWVGESALTTVMAVLFSIYPGFLVLPSANNYLSHLISFVLGLISLVLSLRALRERSLFLQAGMLIPAALLVPVYARIYETMIGLEAIRTVFMAYLLLRPVSKFPTRLSSRQSVILAGLRRLMICWLPFLLTSLVFFYWRFVRFTSSRSATNEKALFDQYRRQPLASIIQLISRTLVDVFETIVAAWVIPLYQRITQAGVEDVLLSILIAAFVILLVLFFIKQTSHTIYVTGNSTAKDALWLGLVITLLSLLPVTVTGRDVRFAYNFDRFTLQSIIGAAMTAGALVFHLKIPHLRWSILSILIAAGCITHILNAAYYRDYWEYERQLWWQMSWRAPDIEKDTTLMILLPPGYRLAEGFEIWAPANLIYSEETGVPMIQGEVLNDETGIWLSSGQTIEKDFRTIAYTLDFNNALLAGLPGDDSCLHLHDGRRIEPSDFEDELLLHYAPFSQIERIITTGKSHSPPTSIFGAEPLHGWCWYYQKACLARQQGNWDEVVRLGDAAQSAGLAPVDASEWLPFIDGYAMLGRQGELQLLSGYLTESYTGLSRFCYGLPEAHTHEESLVNKAYEEICVFP